MEIFLHLLYEGHMQNAALCKQYINQTKLKQKKQKQIKHTHTHTQISDACKLKCSSFSFHMNTLVHAYENILCFYLLPVL